LRLRFEPGGREHAAIADGPSVIGHADARTGGREAPACRQTVFDCSESGVPHLSLVHFAAVELFVLSAYWLSFDLLRARQFR